MKIVKFKYCDEFHCIGPSCPDHCCKEWTILFGKREYLNYKKTDCSKELKDTINKAFARVRDHEKTGIPYDENTNYAKINLSENGECPFHCADGLCMIQKELGERALSHTCSTFPRLYGFVEDEAIVFGCDITCPHVVELMMNHPEGLEVIEEDDEYDSNKFSKNFYTIPKSTKSWAGFPQYWTIKSAQIDILQNRSFTISERLLILGFFSKKADDYIEAGQGEKIESLYSMLLDNEFCRSVADSLKPSQSEKDAAAKSITNFLKMYLYVKQVYETNPILEKYKRAVKSIGAEIDMLDGKFSFNYDMKKYFKSLGIFHGIESERSYIFENMLVNLVFLSPLHEGIFKTFFNLAIFYNTLKISLPAFLKEDWSDTDLAAAITCSAKMALNTKITELVCEKDFENNNSFDLPHIAFMIS